MNIRLCFGRKKRYAILLHLLLSSWLSAASWAAAPQSPLRADAKPTCTVQATTFASWFKSGAVTLDGEVNHANSVTFPDVPNCSFYQWSEQMFLWLTSPSPAAYGGGPGRVFDSAAFFDVSGLDANGNRVYVPHRPGIGRLINVRSAQVGPNGLQIVLDVRGRMFEVLPAAISQNGKSLVRNSSGQLVEIHGIVESANNKLVFSDANGKPIPVPARPKLDTTLAIRVAPHVVQMKPLLTKNFVQGFRAGSTRKVFFVDANGNRVTPTQGQAGDGGVMLAQNGSLVYYATMVNDVYAYFQTGTKNGGITPTPIRFPTTQGELNSIVAFAQSHGRTFPDAEALAVEAKTSWIELTGLDAGKYITATATIPTYDQSNPLLWIPNGTKTVTLGMVGMHVVGSTKGHPEMIWATFEHFGNTPAAAFTYVDTNNQPVSVPQSSTGTWVFSSTNSPTANYNIERMSFTSPNIEANAGETIGPSDTIRWKAWGAASNVAPNPLVTTAGSNTEIISINNSVIGQLANADVRANYMMTGSTWTIGGQPPVGSNEVGTSQLANTTMETYQQGSSTQADGVNCFGCHSGNKVNVSHIFNSLKPLFP